MAAYTTTPTNVQIMSMNAKIHSRSLSIAIEIWNHQRFHFQNLTFIELNLNLNYPRTQHWLNTEINACSIDLSKAYGKKQVLSYNDQKHKHNFRTQDMKPSYTQDPQVGCTFIEDNERSIKNIICTRTRRSSMENTSILNSSMHSVHLVDDDEDCGDFGQVFDIEM